MAARRWQQTQHGAALLIFLILLFMGGLTYIVNSLTPEAVESRRTKNTQGTLAQAREALVGYALRYRDDQAAKDANVTGDDDRAMYGYLPLPDLGSSRNNNIDPKCLNAGVPLEGCDANTFTGIAFDVRGIGPSVVGRFPWRTLGTSPLRDGYGECLWLIVSSLHGRIQGVNPTLPPMNWDTLGQFDIVTASGTSALASVLTSAHDRPIAVIFSPGPALAGQDRSTSTTDDVSECGGNYNAANYLDPATATALGGTTNYLSGTNNASGSTGDSDPGNDPDTPKNLLTLGKLFTSGSNFLQHACQATNCTLSANDYGLPVTNDALFSAIRKNANFRTDINSMLDRMTTCLRDQIAASGSLPVSAIAGFSMPGDKTAGRLASDACYDDTRDPLGYFSHYQDQVFVAKPTTGNFSVTTDGETQSCPGVVIFSGQRGSTQMRSTPTERNTPANYLEGTNQTSFSNPGTTFAGASLFSRVSSTQAAHQDIIRCLPSGASLTAVESPRLTELGVGQLSRYDAATRTLTLGQLDAESDKGVTAQALFGCAWQPETRTLGSGLRSAFKFNIQDTGSAGDGFVFAMVDGDVNGTNMCGAARQHMGYSGNNGYTASIDYPKIGIEIDTRRHFRSHVAFTDPDGFDPSYVGASPASTSHLNNGRADPSYTGGHAAIVYWGGESSISTGIACGGGCVAPQFCGTGSICYLNPEEDDNVHGRSAVSTGSRPPPRNPAPAPSAIATPPAGVYKLDPGLGQVPIEKDVHVRVELVPAPTRSVQLVATANLALSGLAAIDGVVPVAGDRILLTAQADGRQNGVWRAASGAWARDAAEASYSLMPYGTLWSVSAGTDYRGTVWRLSNPDGYVLGSDILTISRTPPYHPAVNSRPVRLAATSTIGLAGLQSIDGVALANGDRVLVTAQSTPAENGVYVASSGAWTRASTENESAELAPNSYWIVTQGSTRAWTLWRTSHDSPPTVGQANIEIVPAQAPWSAVATAPVILSGLQTVGSRTLAAGEWVLVTAQADPSTNGIYHVHNGSWARIPMFQRPWQIQAWVLAYSVTDANRIAQMALISRPLASPDAAYPPHLSDTLTLYSPPVGACTGQAECPTGQWCGIDNICYRPAFRKMRLGFTTAQGTQDQIITISDFASTWLP